MARERYRDIVPEWDRFVEAAGRPEPTSLRVRTGRISPSRLAGRLRAEGFELDPVPGLHDFFRVSREPYPVSKTLEHWLGLFYIQQAVTGVAAPALAARPGERVLDLCAAPGGKTAHLAELMDDRGIVVASDVDDKRLRALLGNVYRLGHLNVLAVQADGVSFPGGARFDRVLVDAPCSGEGNLRQRGGELRDQDPSFVEHVTGLQESLLRRGVALARPGGVILYATCTFAPEENEAVVDAVLHDLPVTVETIDLDVPHAPGLTRFGDRRFDDRLRGAWRLYPHHLDSGGLFLARLRRTDGPAGAAKEEGWRPVPPVFPGDGVAPDEARERIRAGARDLRRIFGVEEGILDSLRWTVRGKSVWAHRCPAWPLPGWKGESGWRPLSLGLRALKRDPRTPAGERPTSDLLRRLDDAVGRRIVELEREALLPVLDRRSLEVAEPDDGFVALRHGGRILGRAWVKNATLRNEISKARSRPLIRFLETDGAGAAANTSGGGPGDEHPEEDP